MDLSLEKQNLRREAYVRRSALSEGERDEKSLRICRVLDAMEELRAPRAVLGYLPYGSECDLSLLYASLRGRGVRLAFPVAAANGTMEAFIPRGALVTGRFGIPEPDPVSSVFVAPAELDAVLVPCVGFDAELGRLGHGGGYYDRYLPRCPRAAAILTAFEAQRLAHVPRETHDLSFSVLVTEAGVFRTGGRT